MARVLLLAVMLPALIAGPAFASGVMLLHSHGPDGLHGHVLHDGEAHDSGAGHAHHAPHGVDVADALHAEHAGHALDLHAPHVDEHGHDLLHDSLHGHVPPGSLTELPTSVWSQAHASRTAVTLSRLLSLEGAGDGLPITMDHAGRELGERPLHALATQPSRTNHGSGASRVLSLSHALLI